MLVSNGFTLESSADRLGRLTRSQPGERIETLRERFAAEGYLWFKGLLARNDVLELRAKIISALASLGLLAPASNSCEGFHSGDNTRRGETATILAEVVRWAAFENFCASRGLQSFFGSFLEGTVHLHRRKILRYTVPGDPSCTGAHYDLTYLRAGTDMVCTAWIPIGDTPVEMGGLVYLEGSDRAGREMEAAFAARNARLTPEERISAFNKNMTEEGWITKDLPSLAWRLDTRWLVADYEAGDVVVHSSYTIHAATVNNDPERRIRLSTDIRYQRESDTIDTRWNSDWTPEDGL